jgi:hypothetical protein
MKVKITDVGAPFYHDGKIGFNVGIEYGEIVTSAFIKPGDDFILALSKEDGAERFSKDIKCLIGTEIEVP